MIEETKKKDLPFGVSELRLQRSELVVTDGFFLSHTCADTNFPAFYQWKSIDFCHVFQKMMG